MPDRLTDPDQSFQARSASSAGRLRRVFLSPTIQDVPILDLPETSLSYAVSGVGIPVLFIHGVGVSGSGWKPQVDALNTNHQTAVFDNRGLGLSTPCRGPITIEAMARDARALMDHLGWTSAHVVGHSMGGIIAQQLALDVPDRVRSLSLLCTFARGKDGARLTPWILWMSLRTRIGSRSMRRRAFLELILPPSDVPAAAGEVDRLAAQLAPLIGRDLADQPPILMKQVQALGRHDASSRLAALAEIPTLVGSAERDPIAPPRFGRQLAACIPCARFELFKDASHAVVLQRPAQVHDVLLPFLREVESSRAAKTSLS